MIRIFLIALFAMFMVTDAASAQNQSQNQSSRRGRFLQRIREDVFGANQQTPPNQPNAQTGQVPTPATGPANNPQHKNIPTPARGANLPNRGPAPVAASRNGFGFNVTVNDKNQLFATKVDRNGNAAEAGIREGDRLLEIGGIESNTVEEFEQIAKIMQSGDQMEFKISRNGNEQKVMVQFGNAPTAEQAIANQNGVGDPVAADNSERRYDFAPPARISPNSRSVLDNPPTANSRRVQPVSQKFSDQTDPRQIQLMQQTIAAQNQEIQKLQREVEQMRRGMRPR